MTLELMQYLQKQNKKILTKLCKQVYLIFKYTSWKVYRLTNILK